MTLSLSPGVRRREYVPPQHAASPSAASLVRALVMGYVVLAGLLIAVGLLITTSFESAANSADGQLTDWLVRSRFALGDSMSDVFSSLGNTEVIVVGLLGFCVAALSARWWQPAYVLAGGLMIELAVFLTVSFWLDRERPNVAVIGSTPSTASFPSGHAAAAVVFYLGLAITATSQIQRPNVRRLIWGVACILAFGVGLARAYRGVHHPSDIVAGWALGIGALLVTLKAVSKTPDPDLSAQGQTA